MENVSSGESGYALLVTTETQECRTYGLMDSGRKLIRQASAYRVLTACQAGLFMKSTGSHPIYEQGNRSTGQVKTLSLRVAK